MSSPMDASLPAQAPALRLGRWWCVVEEGETPKAEDLVRYAAPYLRSAVRREEYEYVLNLAELCWAYATGGFPRRTAVRQALGAGAEALGFLEGMTRRHRRLFPAFHACARLSGTGA